jgi:hypothetical protein
MTDEGVSLQGKTKVKVVNASVLPVADADTPFFIVLGRNSKTVAPEVKKVVLTNRTTNELTFDTAVSNNFTTDVQVHMAGDLPFETRGTDDNRALTVTVLNTALEPAANAVDNVKVAGSRMPLDWSLSGSVKLDDSTNQMLTAYARGNSVGAAASSSLAYDAWHMNVFPFRASEDLYIAGTQVYFDQRVESALAYRGFQFSFAAWVQRPLPGDTGSVQLYYSTDYVTWIDITGSVAVTGAASGSVFDPEPVRVAGTFTLPVTATDVWVRVRVNAISGVGVLEYASLTVGKGGLFLGSGTIPRTLTRGLFGYFAYLWCTEQLTTNERNLLGLPWPSGPRGAIDRIVPAHAVVERFDVSEYDSAGLPKNLKGAYGADAFAAGTLTNTEVMVRDPDRFSFIRPTAISEVEQELSFPATAPYTATLTDASDQDESSALLVEVDEPTFGDDVPVAVDLWQFNSATQVQFTGTPRAGAVYKLTHQRLTRWESAVIDLGAAYADYLWYFDLAVYDRNDKQQTSRASTSTLVFDAASLTAAVDPRGDQDQNASVLTRVLGARSTAVPLARWRYLSSSVIQIDAAEFDPRAMYVLSYNAQTVRASPIVTVKAEVRTGTSSGNTLAATYAVAADGQLVDTGGSKRYAQIRLTLSGVQAVADIVVRGAGFKGLNLFGAGGTVPILKG